MKERAACRDSTISSDSHLQVGHQWFDHCHVDGFNTVWLVAISLRPILGTVAACVTATVWSSRFNFFHFVGVSVSMSYIIDIS